jgi:hypothetical protein
MTHRLSLLLALLFVGCPAPAPQVFEYVLEAQPAGFFSVHGSSASDVWVAGAADTNGVGEPVLIHYDGTRWTRRDLSALGVTGTDLWWVHALSASDVLIGGENGTILRYDGSAFTRMTTPGTRVVFGIWGAASDDVWAVGGQNGGTAGFVWHYDGTDWIEIALPAGHPGAAVFKVWGTASNDVWFCGLMGTLMHWDGSALTMVTSPTMRSLFTLHEAGGEIAVVGGAGSAVILRGTGGAFTDVTPSFDGVPAAQMNGVWLTGPGEGWAVGIYGAILRQDGGTWTQDSSVYDDLHAVWVDPGGGVWAVGGNILSAPFTDGVVIHRGATVSSTVVAE